MIDLSTETVVSLNEAAARFPRRRKGKKTHVSTVYRWAQAGVRGVRLETIQVGATKCTSLEAMQRFCNRLTNPKVSAPTSATPQARQRQIAAAEAELTAAGI